MKVMLKIHKISNKISIKKKIFQRNKTLRRMKQKSQTLKSLRRKRNNKIKNRNPIIKLQMKQKPQMMELRLKLILRAAKQTIRWTGRIVLTKQMKQRWQMMPSQERLWTLIQVIHLTLASILTLNKVNRLLKYLPTISYWRFLILLLISHL